MIHQSLLCPHLTDVRQHQVPRVQLIMHHHARVLPQPPVQLAFADIHRMDVARPRCSRTICKRRLWRRRCLHTQYFGRNTPKESRAASSLCPPRLTYFSAAATSNRAVSSTRSLIRRHLAIHSDSASQNQSFGLLAAGNKPARNELRVNDERASTAPCARGSFAGAAILPSLRPTGR